MWVVILGQAIFVFSIIILVVIYLKLFRRDYLHSPHPLCALDSLIALFPFVTYIIVDHKFFNVYMVPYAIMPIFVRIFMDSRTAFMAMVCSVILSSFALHSNYEFIIVVMMGGMTAVCALKDFTERSQLIRVAFVVFSARSFAILGFDLSQGIDFQHLDSSTYSTWLSTGCFFSLPIRCFT